MIGLSLSCCVRDLIAGLVRYEEVEGIITGTAATTLEEWGEIVEDYAPIYWHSDPDLGRCLVARLLIDQKIEQPRLFGNSAPSISHGHWVATLEEAQLRLAP